jgi:hypothetical protein
LRTGDADLRLYAYKQFKYPVPNVLKYIHYYFFIKFLMKKSWYIIWAGKYCIFFYALYSLSAFVTWCVWLITLINNCGFLICSLADTNILEGAGYSKNMHCNEILVSHTSQFTVFDRSCRTLNFSCVHSSAEHLLHFMHLCMLHL